MKQTAVEWLVEQISYTTTKGEIISYHKDISKLVEQAKEMEKEQIVDAYITSHISMMSAEQYYYETFKQQEQ